MYEQSYVALEILIYLGISVFSEVLALGLGDHFERGFVPGLICCIAPIMYCSGNDPSSTPPPPSVSDLQLIQFHDSFMDWCQHIALICN